MSSGPTAVSLCAERAVMLRLMFAVDEGQLIIVLRYMPYFPGKTKIPFISRSLRLKRMIRNIRV
jgi:hypothetical protein